MTFDLHPTTSRLVDYLKDKPAGLQIPREDIIREFNQTWRSLDPYFRTAKRILFREHNKLVRLGTARVTGLVFICSDAQMVEAESGEIRQTKLRTRRSLKIWDSIYSMALEPTTRVKHEFHQFILSATDELHRTKTVNDLSVKRASNEELKPTKDLLKFLASYFSARLRSSQRGVTHRISAPRYSTHGFQP
jgi:hypothetical protein